MNTPANSSAAASLDLGPLETLLADPTITEIMVDGYKHVYTERNGKIEDMPSPFRDNDHLLEVINALLAPLGWIVDESRPMVDFRLPDGSRVNVVIPPIAVDGPVLTIRKFEEDPLTVEDLTRLGCLTEDMVEFLRACVRGKINILVAGGTRSGKTTVMNCIARMIPNNQRIISVEYVIELQLRQKYVVRLESRPPNSEGKGAVTVQDLVLNALKMRPDHILAGEVKGGEVLGLLEAMNNGHDGTIFTVHANSPHDALTWLEVLATSANPSLPLLNVRQMMASALDLIVHQQRLRDGTRKILKITEVESMQGDAIALADIFEFRETGLEEGKIKGYFTATGRIPKFLNRIQMAGIELPLSLFTPH